MSFSYQAGVVALLLLVTGCLGNVVDMENEEAAVRDAWEELNDAFMSADWDRYSQLWVQSSQLQVVHPAQRDWISGWAEFEPRYRELVASGDQWTFETNRLEVSVDSTGDTAWGVGEVVLTMNGQSQTAWQMVVFRKENERWKIAAAFSSSLASENETPLADSNP